jgi:hypothetical protein
MVEKPIQALDILKQKEKALNASLNGGNKDER